MSVTFVAATKAGQTIGAFVVLNRKGEHVATVQAYYGEGQSGTTVTVNVFDARAMSAEWNDMQTSRGRSLDQALAGLTIDGHMLFDQCGKDAHSQWLMEAYIHDKERIQPRFEQLDWDKKAKKIGAYFTNWTRSSDAYGRSRFDSLFYKGGLERLRVMGYTVICAI